MLQLLFRMSSGFREIESVFSFIMRQRFPPPENFAIMGATINQERVLNDHYSLKNLVDDGILWAVPRNRRTIEKRWKKKYGSPEYVMKLLVSKINIRICNSCGHNHEAGVVCPHCYQKVIEETKMIQERIEKELGLNPIEDEIIVLYEGERLEQPAEYWKGKRVVEIGKPRPGWFSKNLMQNTTLTPTNTKEIKPNELG